MTDPRFATLLETEARNAARYGQKVAFLARCAAQGERVPLGFALSGEEACALVGGDPSLRRSLVASLDGLSRDLVEPIRSLAVRSSPEQSLPGAYLTRLGVDATPDAVVSAVAEVLASSEGEAVRKQLDARHLQRQRSPLALLVQCQVHAARAQDFGAVAFTRDPERGMHKVIGEYLPGTGAEEVVAGRRVPWPLACRGTQASDAHALERLDPPAFAALCALATRLEQHFDEPLELELMQTHGTLWLLQVRPLVMSARALVQTALDAIADDSPSFRRVIGRLLEARGSARQPNQQGNFGGLLERELPPPSALEPARPCLQGLAASPGVGSGALVFDTAAALARAASGPVVLLRSEARPEDVAACRLASAILTTGGGLTSHAAVIARGLRVPAVVGCSEARIDQAQRAVFARHDPTHPLAREGELVTVDAHRGLVYLGSIEPAERIASPELRQLMLELRKLRQVALWAYGAPGPALRAKEEACLDGIICPVMDLTDLPPPHGRECWLELGSSAALDLLPRIPPGWGVVVRGAAGEIPFAELRKLSRLRPLGIHFTEPTPASLRSPALPKGLDLAVVSATVGASEELSAVASRVLVHGDSPQILDGFGHSPNRGLLCETKRTLEWALRLALSGPGTPLRE